MKVLLRKTACFIAVLLILENVLIYSVSYADGKHNYFDVTGDEWYSDYINYMDEHLIMDGISDTLFSPDAPSKRYVIVEAFYRIDNEPIVSSNSDFIDVKHTDSYYNAVLWASENGIIKGYGDGRFGPNDDVTREQLVSIAYRYCKYKALHIKGQNDLQDFVDKDSVSAFAIESMKWAVANTIIIGEPGKILNPKGNVLRCQTAAILHRLINEYELIGNSEIIKVVGTEQANENRNYEAIDDGTPMLIVSSATANRGEVATVTIALKNNPGIASIGLSVAFDKALVLKDVTYNTQIGGEFFDKPSAELNPVKLIWLSPFENNYEDWIFATLDYYVPDDTVKGKYKISISYDPEDIFDLSERNVNIQTISGYISVT
ncbi:MAG: S-layer homology domain-containing protein [Synergistaceae bacterium]|nr:S-layer homology domain-containing protein [Synergistaceae bacterium]